LNDKIESHKNFDKRIKSKNKKLKVVWLNWKILSIQIKKQGLNWKKKLLQKGKWKKIQKSKVKRTELEIPITMRTIVYLTG
jgi:hypothetical protein